MNLCSQMRSASTGAYHLAVDIGASSGRHILARLEDEIGRAHV